MLDQAAETEADAEKKERRGTGAADLGDFEEKKAHGERMRTMPKGKVRVAPTAGSGQRQRPVAANQQQQSKACPHPPSEAWKRSAVRSPALVPHLHRESLLPNFVRVQGGK